MDLFVVPTIGFDLLYAFVIVRLDRRDIIWINVTRSPTAWVARQITEAFPWDEAPKYLIRDRDRIYGSVVTRRLRAMGIRDKPTATASPWQNGFAERLVGSIRRECVDHIIVLGEAQLRRILRSYAHNYIRYQNASVIGQRCASLSRSSVGRKHQIASHHRRTPPPLRPGFRFSIHTGGQGNDGRIVEYQERRNERARELEDFASAAANRASPTSRLRYMLPKQFGTPDLRRKS
jgi:Integrase core domain